MEKERLSKILAEKEKEIEDQGEEEENPLDDAAEEDENGYN